MEETINHFVPAGVTINLTRVELFDIDVTNKLDNEIQQREKENHDGIYKVLII